ncbi:MAG: hypothetical protein M1482_09070 [Chloroflexi bacterium]|nr:hypothetical protein [Chloroflexota bacterium]
MYRLVILKPAERDLKQLDRSVSQQVVKRLRWLTEHVEEIEALPLKDAAAAAEAHKRDENETALGQLVPDFVSPEIRGYPDSLSG